MPKKIIRIPNMPKFPYSPGTRAGDYIFVAGQVGYSDLDTGAAIEGIKAQTKQCLENIKQILEADGASMSDVAKTVVFLTNLEDFPAMNEVYQRYFPSDYPARSTVIAETMIPAAIVEIECIAYSPAGS